MSGVRETYGSADSCDVLQDSKTDLKGMKLSKAELAMKKEAMRSGNNVTLPPDAVHSEWADFSSKKPQRWWWALRCSTFIYP